MISDVTREREHLFLGTRLKRLAEQMQGDVTQLAQQAGIPVQPGQYPLLATIEANGPQTVSALARALGMSQPAATKAVERLRRTGLVAAGADPRDGRQRPVALTTAGRDVLERSRREIWPLVEAAVRETVDDLAGPLLEQIATIEARLAERPLSRRAADAAVRLVPADPADLPEVAALMNRAYRGPDAGWTNEAGYLDGDRTSVAMLAADLAGNPAARLMLWRRGDGSLRGCVWLEPEAEGRWYLGSLTVDPGAQNAGHGRQLLAAAEDWIRARGGRSVRMTVVNVRDTLIAWYERRGYARTGATEPFPYEDARFGVPRRDDLAFVELARPLGG